jgi:ABC-type lipoprotein export system ATPase subunit
MTTTVDEPTLGALERRARQRTGTFGEDALIACDSLVRIYQSEGVEVQALQGLDLLVDAGELVAIVGASGSGKSTLLAVLSGLDVPTAGRVRVGDWDLMAMSSRQRVEYRRSMVGFVWQQTARNLVPYLTATENVTFPMALAGVGRKERAARAAGLLAMLGIASCADRRPGQLSEVSSSASRSP